MRSAMTTATAIPTVHALPTANAPALLGHARAAQIGWCAMPVRERLRIIGALRHRLAEQAEPLGDLIAAGSPRSAPEAMVSEVLPLADACRYLQRTAQRTLKPRRCGARLRPLWLTGTRLTVYRRPVGVIAILAPNNYPLMLSGIQAVQALAAGNAVVVKPAPGCEPVTQRFAELLREAGLPDDLLTVTDSDVATAEALLDARPDKVILTGSVETGRAVSARLAASNTPAVMELSGCDAALVCDDADVNHAAKALAFGLRFNGGRTCIAPRRIIAARSIAEALEAALKQQLASVAPMAVPAERRQRIGDLIDRAREHGARLVCGDPDAERWSPIVLADVPPSDDILHEDLFAPVGCLQTADDEAAMIETANDNPYGLGATVFTGDRAAARRIAGQLDVGCVVVNDMIAPTADPRLPFEGRKASGHGPTRGDDGLLACTTAVAVVERRRRSTVQYEPLHETDRPLAAAMLNAMHGRTAAQRLKQLTRLIRLGRTR